MSVLGKQQWDDALVAGFKAGVRALKRKKDLNRIDAQKAWGRSKWGGDYIGGYCAVIDLSRGAYATQQVDVAVKLGLVKPGVQRLNPKRKAVRRNPKRADERAFPRWSLRAGDFGHDIASQLREQIRRARTGSDVQLCLDNIEYGAACRAFGPATAGQLHSAAWRKYDEIKSR